MKKDASKKSKLWLWLAVVAVVAAAAVAAVLFLLPGGTSDTEPTETTGTVQQASTGSPLYWNLDRSLYMEKGATSSTREVAEDGFYHIAFAHDGKEEELLVADKKLVNFIDTMDIMGLSFDESGNVVDAIAVKEIATELDPSVYVQSVEGNVINVNSSIAMSGMKKKYEITDATPIYDVIRSSENRGAAITADQLGPMDKIAVYGDMDKNLSCVYLLSHPRTSKIYWRANQFTSGGKTTRVPDENGVYTIPFYCEGELVEFKCKNVTEVNYIDKQSIYSSHFGLVFDAEGYIEEAILSSEALPGIIRSERYDVTAIDGDLISTQKIIGSNVGTTDQFNITADTPIYDVSPAAVSEGRAGQRVESLTVGDRIVCFADTENNPLFVYIAEHIVEEAVWCYNIERKYDSTNQTTKREPDSNGWYYIKVFAEGVIKTVKTQSLETINAMDSVGAAVFGITLDGDVVKHVYNVRSVFGYTHFGQGRYITSAKGSIFTCFKTSAPNTAINGIMAPGCKIWNLSPVGTYGAETKLQYGDYIYAYQSPDAMVQQIFVIRRITDLPVYYGLERMYNSTTKETTREPVDGWYYYEVYRDGKKMTVKTNSKAMASTMDAINPAVMALRVDSDGVVHEAYEGKLTTGGYRRAHGYTVLSINGNVIETNYKNSDGTIATRTLTLAENCKTVNITTLDFAKSTTVRVGDTITAFTDIYDQTSLLVVRNRKTDYLYWNQLKMYDDTNKVTMRTPDADGWYVFTLLRNDGKIVTLKTQDKDVASRVDYYGGAFTLNVKDGVILGVGSPGYAKNTNGSSLLNYDVVSVSGRTVTLSNGKDTQKITLSSDCKIFEVGPDAATFGAEVKLKVGDRVRAYKSLDGTQFTFVFIRFHASREQGTTGYCGVCKKDVKWEPWVGGSFATAGGHFYLPADITTEYLPCSTGRSKTFPTSTVCLDLNGHTYYRTNGRAMYVYTNGTLNIMDSVGGGVITSGGIANGTSGGVLGIAGGTVNLHSGTLRLADVHNVQYRAGVVYVSKGADEKATPGTLNMYGGLIENGKVLSRGGNVDVNGGVFNMRGGEIRGGVVGEGYEQDVTCYGGNVAIRGNGIFNMYDGIISGGEAYKNGGNVYSGTGVTTIYGGTITGGTTKTSGGGNIYAIGQLHIHGGTITKGVSEVKSGGNIYVYRYTDETVFSAENCTISGGSAPEAYGGNIYCEVGGTLKNVTITDGKAKNAGNVYISGAAVLEKVTITNGTASESGGNIFVAGTCDMYDVTITGGTSGARGGNIYANGKALTIHSGLISDGTSGTGNSNGGGNIFALGGCVLEIAGGKVVNGTSANTGGNILVGTATLVVSGGEITGGTAPEAGADIYAYYDKSNVIITGGKIGTLTYTDAENPIEISGKPVIGLLEIAPGKLITLGEVSEGAVIPVSASGVFTTELADVNAYDGIVTCAVEGMKLVKDGNTLAIRGETTTAHCPVCNEDAQWSKWNGTILSGHVYLTENVTLDAAVTIPEGSELTLDLKGFTLTNETGRAFLVNGSLKVVDSVGSGQIVGAENGNVATSNGGVIRVSGGSFDLYSGTVRYAGEGVYQGGVLYLEKSATANLRGGTVTGGITNERGGNISVAGASHLIISGATVENGNANSSNSNGGGNIFIVGSSLVEITGGRVVGGKTTKTGGNILVGTGTLKVTGGEISGGSAAKAGKNVYVYYTASNAEITGGTIESVYYLDAASFKLSGNPVIGILEIASGKLVELGNLTSGADIKVIAEDVFTTENENAQTFVDQNFVKAYSNEKTVAVIDNKLTVTEATVDPEPTPDPEPEPEPEPDENTAPCVHCNGENAVWTAWDGVATNGHFYLAAHMDATEEVSVPAGESLVLDLRGFGYRSTGRAFFAYGQLAVMDTVGGGEVVGAVAGTAASTRGGVIRVSGGSFMLYSGTVRYAGTGVNQGGVLYLEASATAQLMGGVVENGISKDRGGNIAAAGKSTLTISGTTVQKGTAISGNSNGGGNIFVVGESLVEITGGKVVDGYTNKTGGNILVGTGTLVVSGGEITGGVADKGYNGIFVYYKDSNATFTGGLVEELAYTDAQNPVKISGNPVIERFDIKPGKIIELGQLTEGAHMSVRGEGVFTNESDYAAEILEKGYIEGGVSLEGKTLVLAAAQMTETCPHCGQKVTWNVWDGTAVTGHFYLTDNAPLTMQVSLAEGNDLVIDLNGYHIYSEARAFLIPAGASLSILDTAGCGRVTGKGLDGENGGVLSISGGKFDLYGGTLALSREHKAVKRGGVIITSGAAQVTIHDGVVENGVTTERGGNFYVGGGSLTVSGGIIRGGTAISTNANGGGNIFALGSSLVEITGGQILDGHTSKTGGNICVGTATLKVTGGEIAGGTADGVGQNVYIYYNQANAEITGGNIESVTYTDSQNPVKISGNPVIGLLEIAAGKVIELGQLTDGADITVDGQGAFTQPVANAADYIAKFYIKPAEGKELTDENGTLTLN